MLAFWGYPSPPHDYPYYWVILDPKSKEDKVKVTNLKNLPKLVIVEFWNKHCTRHTFWSCSIRSANMKWIRLVLLKIQSGHDSVHRQTDGRTRWNQYTPLSTLLKRGYDYKFIVLWGIIRQWWYNLLLEDLVCFNTLRPRQGCVYWCPGSEVITVLTEYILYWTNFRQKW